MRGTSVSIVTKVNEGIIVIRDFFLQERIFCRVKFFLLDLSHLS